MTSGMGQHRLQESRRRIRFPRCSMMWLRRCCCCCCGRCAPDREDKPTSPDDSSSLIGQEEQHPSALTSQEHAFYVPRRHSSFLPSSSPYNSTCDRRSDHPHSDCSSSSDEEGAPPTEQRGRCWSTVPALDATTFAAGHRTTARNRPNADGDQQGTFVFDRHVLSEIAEVERGAEGGEECCNAPSGNAPTPRTDVTEVYGHLTFTAEYDTQEQRLAIFLKRATGLPKKGDEPYGTFVRMTTFTTSGYSNSNNGYSGLSRTVKKNLNPVYGEKHDLPLHNNQRSKWKSTRSTSAVYLRLSVIDCERRGRHDAIGHALLSLDEIGAEKREHRLPLTPMSLPVRNLGQVLIGLHYTATQSRLAVHVIKARHLRLDAEVHKRHLRPFNRDVIDSFCKVTLTCGGQKVKTCRSRAVTGTDPFFDFRSNFVVPPQYLRDASAIVSVVARSTLGRQGVTLGRAAVLGPYVETEDGSATQWGRMVLEGRSVVQWRNIYL